MQQLARAVLVATLANAACTDGVGTPIREELQSDEDGGPTRGPDGRTPRSCDDVAEWRRSVAESERELLEMINARRMEGECGNGQFEAHPPLRLAPELQCSARLHSADMFFNGLWDRDDEDEESAIGSDGSYPSERMRAAGFEHGRSAESRVAREDSALEALEDLERIDSNGCWNLSQREFTHIGIGRYADFWTVDFAQELSAGGSAGP
jgi:hypothetical protein